jgi:hypothetical protein
MTALVINDISVLLVLDISVPGSHFHCVFSTIRGASNVAYLAGSHDASDDVDESGACTQAANLHTQQGLGVVSEITTSTT